MKRVLPFLRLLGLLLTWQVGLGQNYPVQVQAIARAPYSNYLADLANPASEQLYVTLMLKDLQLANRQVRLKVSIEGPGTRIMGADNVPAAPVNLLPGSMVQVSGTELATYFRPENLQIPPAQYGKALAEGMYRFCFTVFDYQTNQQLSATVCSNYAWIQRSDPPLLVLPTNSQMVPAMAAQQVLFQWVPRHSQVNATEYELTITELIVPQGFTANPQNLFFAQPPYFVARTSGTTYLYGPAQPPLTPGRLYGYRVRALPKMGSEGQTSFVNDGYSQVGFFTYGQNYASYLNVMALQSLQRRNTPPPPPDNIAKLMKGRVVWSFKKTELEPDTAKSAWVVPTPAQAWRETFREVRADGEKSSVANPMENAQVNISANGRLIGTAKTDKDGNYEIKGFNPDVLQGVTSLSVRATMSEDFMPVTRTVAIKRGQTEYDLGQNVLIAQTFRLATQVIATGIPKEDVTLRVLRRKEIVDRLPYLVKEGNGPREAITYNGQAYVSVATVTSSAAARRIFYNTIGGDQFVVQVQARDKSPMYVPLSAVNPQAGQDGNKQLVYIKRNYTYKSSITLAGRVGTQNPSFTAREGVRIRVTVRGADMGLPTSGTMVGFAKMVTSDKNGQYTLSEIPLLRRGAQLRIEAVDNTLSPVPQLETVSFTGSEVIQKDITLRAAVSLITGIVNDQYGKPVKGALVKVQGSGQVIRTNEYGYFIVKSFRPGPVNLTFAGNALADTTASFTPSQFNWNQTSLDENRSLWEKTLTDYASAQALLRAAEQTALTPELLGYADESLAHVFDRLRLPNEELTGMADAGIVTMYNKQGLIRFVTTLDTEPVAAQIELSTGKKGETGDGKSWDHLAEPDIISYSVQPVDGGITFLPTKGEVSVEAGEAITITLALERGVLLKGTITDDSTDAPLAEATVEVKGLPYKTTTDEEGNYSLGVPIGREISLRISADDYEAVDSTLTFEDSGTLDLALAAADSSLPEVETLMGFKVKIDNIEEADDDKFTISGTLIPDQEGAFRGDDDLKLTFSDVEVEVDDDGNAVPSEEIEFEEVELKLKAFGFAPVLLESKEGLVLQPMVADEEKGMIGGEKITLDTDRVKTSRGFDLNRLPKTSLELIKPLTGNKEDREKQQEERKEQKEEKAKMAGLKPDEPDFVPAFASPEVELLATSTTARYRLVFGKAIKTINPRLTRAEVKQLDTDSETYLPMDMNFMTFLFSREKCELNNKGIDFVGKVRVARAAGFIIKKDILIDKFTLGKRFELKELILGVNKSSILTVNLGSWRAKLDRMMVYDDFKGIGFGGSIGSTNNVKNDFKIDKLYYINGSDGLKIGGKITLPDDGYKIGAMSLTTPNGFELAYQSKTRVFEIDGSLKLDYKGKTKNSVLKVFPLEVQRFVYRTNNQLFIAVKANVSVALGPVKVNVRRFLFNRGVGMTLDEMNRYLELDQKEENRLTSSGRFDKAEAKAAKADPDKAEKISQAKQGVDKAMEGLEELGAEEEEEEELMVEEKVSWGVGIAGGVEISVPSLQVRSDASVLLVEKDGSVQVRVNEFLFAIDNSSFKAQVRGKGVYEENKEGFEGSGEFETLSRKFACGFKFYKTGPGASDLELGLSLLASTNIPMGSVTWTQLGGQIDFNIREKKYYVALMGALTPTGVDKKLVEFDRVKVSILFDLIECGAKPVIKGSAGAKLRGEDWGVANVTLDFCRTRLIVDLKSEVEVMKGLGRLRVDAVLYAKTSMVFFGCNARLDVPKIGTINALIALGVQARRNEMPEAETIWRQVSGLALDDNNNYFNGINIRGDATLARQSGGYRIGLGVTDAEFSYEYWASTNLEFYYRFSNNNFGVYANINIGGSASARISDIRLNGGANANLTVRGGYNDWQGWNFGGNINVAFYIDNDQGRGCNSAGLRWCDTGVEICIPKPCWGWCTTCWRPQYICGASFKLCRDINASFNWQSR